jgi:hypothetical protein
MGILSRKPDPDKDLARAIAENGISGRATVLLMSEGADGRHEFLLDVGGEQRRVSQRMAPQALYKIAVGEPLSVMYDPADVSSTIILGHANYRMTEHGMIRVEDV